MANDATQQQLPIMVRRPRIVWPGLDRMDMHRKMIAGDGNCLFASLADQMYGSPAKHTEIRAAIIDHMRDFRPLFENVAIKDDIQQKRATRAQTNAIRNSFSDDPFEEYLAIMSQLGTYGGEPELVAFVQRFDQDVLIHLPHMLGYPESIPYTNQHRLPEMEPKPMLHLCYGGDESANAHYDSVQRNKHVVPILDNSKAAMRDLSPSSSTSSTTRSLTSRAIRGSRSDISRDMMHDLVVRGSSDLKYSFDQLNESERARSPSITSSHHSNSSKRSFDDEGEPHRTTKRTDRKKSARSRAAAGPSIDLTGSPQPASLVKVKLNAGLATPTSTQDSEVSSDQSEHGSDEDRIKLRPRARLVNRALTPDTGDQPGEPPRRGSANPSTTLPIPIARKTGTHDMKNAALSI